MTSKGRYKTRVITHESQVPDGFVNLRSYCKGNETLRRLMCKWHTSGLVPAVKLLRTIEDRTGPVWICKESVERFAVEQRESLERLAAEQAESPLTSPQADPNEAVVLLRRVAASLDHLVALWEGKGRL